MDYLSYIENQTLLSTDSLEYLQLADFLRRFPPERYGEGHILLAAHAAFPVFLSPDLLYKIWLNFQRFEDEHGAHQKIPRVAVSDLLLSGLLREIAVEVFEMPAQLRTALLACLEARFAAGGQRVQELAQFMLYYVRSYQLEGESVTSLIREAQEWNALAYVDPAAAARNIRQALAGAAREQSATRQLRIGLMLERLDQQYQQLAPEGQRQDTFRTLLSYSQGMREFLQGRHQEALRAFESLQSKEAESMQAKAGVKRVTMPIPRTVSEGLRNRRREAEPIRGKVHALLVGIDQYPHLTKLKGCANDVREMSAWLEKSLEKDRLILHTILDAEANRAAVVQQLQRTLAEARQEDAVLFYFGGHGMNRRQNQERNSLVFVDYQENQKGSGGMLYDDEVQAMVEGFGKEAGAVVLILDTHAGSSNWLPPDDDRCVVLSGCGNDEISYEENERGVFSAALAEVIKQGGGQISYRQLTRQIREKIQGRYQQTPQLLGTPSAKDRMLLSVVNDPAPPLLERLSAAGYYEGPLNAGLEAATAALNRFRADWAIDQEEDILECLDQKILADRYKRLPVLLAAGHEQNEFYHFLREKIQQLPYPVELSQLDDPNELIAQKYQSQISTRDTVGPESVDRAGLVVLLIDREFLAMEESRSIVNRIQERRQLDYLPVVALLAGSSSWPSHPVAGLPEMRLYRSKGRFGERDWLEHQGWNMVKDSLDAVGRFMSDPSLEEYLSFSDHFREDMSMAEMERLGAELREKAGALANLRPLISRLRPEAPQADLYACAIALQVRGTVEYIDPLGHCLAGIAQAEKLGNVRLNVLYQLVLALQRLLLQKIQDGPSLDEARREFQPLIDTLLSMASHARVKDDNRRAGKGGLGSLIHQLVGALCESTQSNPGDQFFRFPLVAETLRLDEFQGFPIDAKSPEFVPALDLLHHCERFDGEMSISAMDRLATDIRKILEALPNPDFLIDRLGSPLFQGYIFGAALAAEAHPKAEFFSQLVQFLQSLPDSPDLGYLRLRVIYRLVMALEVLAEADRTRPSPEIAPQELSLAIDVLDQLSRHARVLADDEKRGAKSIGARIKRVIRKIGLAMGDSRAQDLEIRERIEKARQRRKLRLDELQLQEIPELVRELKDLESLVLNYNQLSSLPAWLPELAQLRELELARNQLTDIGPLKGMTQLQELDLFKNDIRDISPLGELTGLTRLNLSHNAISDIGPMAGMTQLKGIDLEQNQISDIRPLLNIESPQWVDLRFNQIAEIPPETRRWNLPYGWGNTYKPGIYLQGNPLPEGVVTAIEKGEFVPEEKNDLEKEKEHLISILGESVEVAIQELKRIVSEKSDKRNDILLLESKLKESSLKLLKGIISDEEFQNLKNELQENARNLIRSLQEADTLSLKEADISSEEIPSFQQTLRQKIAKDNIPGLFHLLETHLKKDSSIYNDFLVYRGQEEQRNRDRILVIISQEEDQIRHSRLLSNLLELINRIKPEDLRRSDVPDSPQGRGVLQYDLPSSWESGQQRRVVVRIAPTESLLLENQLSEEKQQLREIRIADVMAVELIDPSEKGNFQIRTFSETQQFIDKDIFTEWIFYVTNSATGIFPLLLKVSVFELINGEERKRDIILEEKVEIHPPSAGSPPPDAPTLFLDPRDSQTYRTLEHQGRLWMAEDLRFDAGEGCYAYESELGMGRLYSWEAAQRACPPGWRLPTTNEWMELVNAYGGFEEDLLVSSSLSAPVGDPGAAFKALGPGGESGFEIRPAGQIQEGRHEGQGQWAGFWSTATFSAGEAEAWFWMEGRLLRRQLPRHIALSCRCVKEDDPMMMMA